MALVGVSMENHPFWRLAAPSLPAQAAETTPLVANPPPAAPAQAAATTPIVANPPPWRPVSHKRIDAEYFCVFQRNARGWDFEWSFKVWSSMEQSTPPERKDNLGPEAIEMLMS